MTSLSGHTARRNSMVSRFSLKFFSLHTLTSELISVKCAPRFNGEDVLEKRFQVSLDRLKTVCIMRTFVASAALLFKN
jgi:hypothetical protein